MNIRTLRESCATVLVSLLLTATGVGCAASTDASPAAEDADGPVGTSQAAATAASVTGIVENCDESGRRYYRCSAKTAGTPLKPFAPYVFRLGTFSSRDVFRYQGMLTNVGDVPVLAFVEQGLRSSTPVLVEPGKTVPFAAFDRVWDAYSVVIKAVDDGQVLRSDAKVDVRLGVRNEVRQEMRNACFRTCMQASSVCSPATTMEGCEGWKNDCEVCWAQYSSTWSESAPEGPFHSLAFEWDV